MAIAENSYPHKMGHSCLKLLDPKLPGDLNRCAQRRMGQCYFQLQTFIYGLLPKGYMDSN